MKRSIFVVLPLLAVSVTALSQPLSVTKSYSDYFDTYAPLAIAQMQAYGIPASITLAQGVLESGAGQSRLAIASNNHFGIKCGNGWSGPRAYHDDDRRDECFRAYSTVADSYADHALFLTGNARYSRLFRLRPTDYKGWASGLKACGYATSPTYAKQLIGIIETYQLYRYDREGSRVGKPGRLGGRQLYDFNSNYYILARRGDTFQRIASDVGISARRLAKFNERSTDDTLEEGEPVWLKQKRRKAPKEFKNRLHHVAAGESMYSISQRYGIRLKRLYKMNSLSPDYVLKVGDELRVR